MLAVKGRWGVGGSGGILPSAQENVLDFGSLKCHNGINHFP